MNSSGRFCGNVRPAGVDTAAENTLLAQLKQWTQQSGVCEEGEQHHQQCCVGSGQTPQQSQLRPVRTSTQVCRRAPAWFWIFQDLSMHGQDTENFAPPFPDVLVCSLLSINHIHWFCWSSRATTSVIFLRLCSSSKWYKKDIEKTYKPLDA